MKYSKLHQVKKISNEPKIITQSLLKIKIVLDILYWFLFKRNIRVTKIYSNFMKNGHISDALIIDKMWLLITVQTRK
jgi:hypothetical protein